MYRRVGAPILLVVGVWIAMTSVSYGFYLLGQVAIDSIMAGKPAWLLPVLPLGQWPIVLAIFAAVRMCAMRGGSSRECILVGLSPLVPAAVLYAFLFSQVGASALPTLVGIISPVLSGEITLSAVIAARQYASDFLGLVAICITVTWMYLWVGDISPTPDIAD